MKGCGGCAGTSLTYSGFTSQLTRLLQLMSCCHITQCTLRGFLWIHALVGQSCFESTWRINDILGRAGYNVLDHQEYPCVLHLFVARCWNGYSNLLSLSCLSLKLIAYIISYWSQKWIIYVVNSYHQACFFAWSQWWQPVLSGRKEQRRPHSKRK